MLCTLLQLYLYIVFARILLSWFPVTPGGALAQITHVLYNLTEPVLGPIRRAIPPVRFGSMGLDLSPIIVFIGGQLLLGQIC